MAVNTWLSGEVVGVEKKLQYDGCEFHRSCLDCPFPVCKEEVGTLEFRRIIKLQEVEKLWQEGKKAMEIAEILEVSVKTVQRRLHQLEQSE